jgi:hypothetical protein
MTRNPPAGLDPLARGGDLVLDLEREIERGRAGDMDTSDPRLRRGGDGESGLGERDRPLPSSDIVLV